MKPFIGIKQLWYGNVLASDLSGPTAVATLVASMTEIKNVHQGTWGYSQDDPSVTEYVNELTGQPYYRDKETLGARTITFSLGVYDFETKAALQGGAVVTEGEGQSAKTVGWKSSGALENVNKCIVAKTKTGNWIVFSNAAIVAKGDQQDKNITLGITAVCMESETTGVEAEYMFEAASA